MENENFDSSNINFKWLENIYEQLKDIQEMERLSKEGCRSLIEYINVPNEVKGLLLPEIQYKNLRFAVLELNILIDNLKPILKDKTDKYKLDITTVLNTIDKREDR